MVVVGDVVITDEQIQAIGDALREMIRRHGSVEAAMRASRAYMLEQLGRLEQLGCAAATEAKRQLLTSWAMQDGADATRH